MKTVYNSNSSPSHAGWDALCLHKEQTDPAWAEGAPEYEQRSGDSRSEHESATLRVARVNCGNTGSAGAPEYEQRSGDSRSEHESATLRVARVNCGNI